MKIFRRFNFKIKPAKGGSPPRLRKTKKKHTFSQRLNLKKEESLWPLEKARILIKGVRKIE